MERQPREGYLVFDTRRNGKAWNNRSTSYLCIRYRRGGRRDCTCLLGEDESALYLGDLSGMAGQWSVSVFEVPLDAIQNTNPVYITVSDSSGDNAWEVEVAWAQLIFDGGPGIDARVDEPTVIYSGNILPFLGICKL